MKVLALESSTACGSVAVLIDGEVLSFEKSMASRSHAEFMNPATERCLKSAKIKLSEIDVFACGLGPGSFTGLRVSESIAKSFSMTFEKPMVAIDSLTLLKEEAVHIGKFSGNSYLCLINAFKNMVYAAHFDQKNALVSPIAMTLPQLHDLAVSLPDKVLGLGDGFTAFAEFLQPALMSKIHRSILYPDFPLASTLAKMAEKNALRCQTLDWKTFKPLYIRASAAEENLKLKI